MAVFLNSSCFGVSRNTPREKPSVFARAAIVVGPIVLASIIGLLTTLYYRKPSGNSAKEVPSPTSLAVPKIAERKKESENLNLKPNPKEKPSVAPTKAPEPVYNIEGIPENLKAIHWSDNLCWWIVAVLSLYYTTNFKTNVMNMDDSVLERIAVGGTLAVDASIASGDVEAYKLGGTCFARFKRNFL